MRVLSGTKRAGTPPIRAEPGSPTPPRPGAPCPRRGANRERLGRGQLVVFLGQSAFHRRPTNRRSACSTPEFVGMTIPLGEAVPVPSARVFAVVCRRGSCATARRLDATGQGDGPRRRPVSRFVARHRLGLTAAAGLPPERVVDGLCLGAVPIGAAGTDAALDVTRNARITRPLTAPVPQRQRRSAILRSTAALRAGRIGVTRLGGKETAALPATAGQTELPTTIDAAGAAEGIAAQAEADRTARSVVEAVSAAAAVDAVVADRLPIRAADAERAAFGVGTTDEAAGGMLTELRGAGRTLAGAGRRVQSLSACTRRDATAAAGNLSIRASSAAPGLPRAANNADRAIAASLVPLAGVARLAALRLGIRRA